MRLKYFAGITSPTQAKARHRELAAELHPDRNPENSSAFVMMQREYEQVMLAFQLRPELQGGTTEQRGNSEPRADPPKQRSRSASPPKLAAEGSRLPTIRHTQPPPERNTLADTAKELGKQLVTGLAVAAIEKIVEHVNRK